MRLVAFWLLLAGAGAAQDFTGELNLLLENALVRDGGGNADIELYPTCVNGTWEKDVLGWNYFLKSGDQPEWRAASTPKSYNAMDHEGAITASAIQGDTITLKIKLTVNPDPWLPGGHGEYAIELKRDGARVTGTYAGTYKDKPVNGTARGTIKSGAWLTPLPGYVPLQAGEHPRLMFRATDVPALRAKAKTPEGKAMLERLEASLKGPFTLWHGCGYGLLYQVTGDKKFAEEAKKYVEMARNGTQQRDSRYSYTSPNGRLRAGPSYAAIAEAYDLCYDAWEPAYREALAKELQEKVFSTTGKNDLCLKTEGGQHHPQSNHYMAWNGGAGTVMVAVLGDPGVNNEVVQRAIRIFTRRGQRSLTVAHGDHGYFFEGHHCGRLNENTGFYEFLQALRVAQGRDLTSYDEAGSWLLTKWIYELVRYGGQLQDLERGMYARDFARTGMSSGGDFAHGFGLCPDAHKPAVLWFANHLLDPPGTQRYDIMSYPHRGVYAFVNWPVGLPERNPAEVLPRFIYDKRANYLIVRSGWQGNSDIVLTMRHGDGMATGAGLGRARFASFQGTAKSVTAAADGLLITIVGTEDVTLIDLTGKAGAPVLMVSTDRQRAPGRGKVAAEMREMGSTAPVKVAAVKRGDADEPDEPVAVEGEAPKDQPAKLTRAEQWANGYFYVVHAFQSGPPPLIGAVGDGEVQKLKVGNQTYTCDGKVILAGQ